jgi:putative acetyltransferase
MGLRKNGDHMLWERLLPLTIALESPNQPGVIRLLEMSDTYMASLYPAESNHLLDITQLEKPGVWFLVARQDDEIVGCASLVEAGDGTAEIKRMFVDPEARGLKLGRRLMEALEALGREKGLTAIRLETGISQPEALGLYRAFGYVEIGPFGEYVEDPLSQFMEKRLG